MDDVNCTCYWFEKNSNYVEVSMYNASMRYVRAWHAKPDRLADAKTSEQLSTEPAHPFLWGIFSLMVPHQMPPKQNLKKRAARVSSPLSRTISATEFW